MIVLKLSIFVFFLAGSYCMTPACFALKNVECGEYDIREEKRPETVEDLRNFCSVLIPYGLCTLRVVENCAKNELIDDDEEDVERLRKTLSFVQSSCDEDSRIFNVIADNLHCVMSTLDAMDDICHYSGLNTTYRQKIYNLVDDDTGCAIDAWVFYCMNARFSVECGNNVRDAAAEILENIDYVSPYCKEMRQELLYFEPAFETEFRKGKNEATFSGILESISQKIDQKQSE